jgi:hypothetical protein
LVALAIFICSVVAVGALGRFIGSTPIAFSASAGPLTRWARAATDKPAAVLSRSSVSTRERPQSPTLICSTASAEVKFQDGPVVRPGNRHGLLGVVSRSS